MQDPYTHAQMSRTAAAFQKLAALRGISSSVTVSGRNTYVANGEDCGTSVHGLYDWLNRQPGVRP
jgi:hypothetical protein